MIDFVFAVIAAGVNAAGSGGGGEAPQITQAPTPAEVVTQAPAAAAAEAPTITAPEIKAPSVSTPGTPSVVIGENVTIGSSSVIAGGNLLGGTNTNEGSALTGWGLLDGTSDQAAAAPAAADSAPAPQTSEFNMSVVPAGLVAEPQEPTGKFTTAAEVKPIMTATKGNWVAVREYDGQDLLYVTHIWGWRCGLHAMAISVNGEPMQNWPLPPCHMKYTTPSAILEEDGLPYLRMRLGSVQTIDIQLVYDDLSMDTASFERGNILIP
jgi:hypothetical protein